MNDGNAFHEDREFVLSNLQDGNLDHVEGVSRVVETPFFQKFIGDGDLAKLAATYPTPRQKEEKKLTPAEQKSCRFRRYYQLVSLSHTSRKSDFLLYSGSRVVRTGVRGTAARSTGRGFRQFGGSRGHEIADPRSWIYRWEIDRHEAERPRSKVRGRFRG